MKDNFTYATKEDREIVSKLLSISDSNLSQNKNGAGVFFKKVADRYRELSGAVFKNSQATGDKNKKIRELYSALGKSVGEAQRSSDRVGEVYIAMFSACAEINRLMGLPQDQILPTMYNMLDEARNNPAIKERYEELRAIYKASKREDRE